MENLKLKTPGISETSIKNMEKRVRTALELFAGNIGILTADDKDTPQFIKKFLPKNLKKILESSDNSASNVIPQVGESSHLDDTRILPTLKGNLFFCK